MRKFLISFAGLLMVFASLMAQTPAAFKYQAVARNASGEVMADKTMDVRIGLYKGITMEYSEVHTVTTNDLGLFSLEVGRGSPEQGNFFDIAWGDEPHFVRIEIDPNGSNNYMFLGMSELLSVPYSMHSETVQYNDDADADPSNELQDLKLVGPMLRVTGLDNPTVVDISQFNTDDQQLTYDADNRTIHLEDGGSINLTNLANDADSDPSNELQELSQVGTIVTLSNGGGSVNIADSDADATNELQILTQSGNTITLSNGGGSVVLPDDDATNEIQDLNFNNTNNLLHITNNPNATIVDFSPYLDNTDEQQIGFDNQTNILTLQDGGSVDLSAFMDDTDTDTDSQQLAFDGGTNTLTLQNGGAVDLSGLKDSMQTISQNGIMVTLSHGGGTFSIADDDNNPLNEIQDLLQVGDTLIITSNPMATMIDLAPYKDNTDAQDMDLSGNTLSLTGDATTVDLTPFMDNTDEQNLSFNGTHLSIDSGNTVDISSLEDDADADPSNEIQDLLVVGDTLIITNNLFASPVDLSPYMDNTDAQDMDLSGNTLSLTGDATTVDLTPYLDNTDAQDMDLTGNTLSVTGDATTVDLTPYLDNTDAQDMDLTGNTLSITGDATTVDLTPYLDNTDAQDMDLTGNTLSITGDATTVDLSSFVQDIDLSGNTLSFSGDATTVDLAPYLDNTDAQDLDLAGNILSVTGDATTVDLSAYLDNTDAQDLDLAGNILSVTGDATTVDLSAYLDNTDAQDLGLAGNILSVTGDATTVDLSAYLDNTDAQDLDLAGNILSVTGDATTVDLSAYLDNTDAQDLTLAGNTLSLSGDATTIDLSAYLDADDLGSHVAAQNILMDGYYLSNDGADEGILVGTTGNVTATGNFFVGENAGTNSDIYISGWMFDWDDNNFNVDPNNESTLNNLTVETALTVNADVEVGAANAFYMGDPTVDGSWRIVRSGANLVFELRELGVWVTKSTIIP